MFCILSSIYHGKLGATESSFVKSLASKNSPKNSRSNRLSTERQRFGVTRRGAWLIHYSLTTIHDVVEKYKMRERNSLYTEAWGIYLLGESKIAIT